MDHSAISGARVLAPNAARRRGLQTTDTSGRVTFNTIYPGWYPGRATHMHFRMYLALDLQATSQLAFPNSFTSAVYASPLRCERAEPDDADDVR